MIWVSHMKTTIDIADPILRRVKQLAARRETTLKDLVEQALRDLLDAETGRPPVEPIRPVTVGGSGLQPGLSWDDWAAIRDRAYEGRGG